MLKTGLISSQHVQTTLTYKIKDTVQKIKGEFAVDSIRAMANEKVQPRVPYQINLFIHLKSVV